MPVLSRRDLLAGLWVIVVRTSGVGTLKNGNPGYRGQPGFPFRAVPTPEVVRPFVIGRIGRLDDDESAGVRLGLLEATRTAALLGITVAVSDEGNRANTPFGVIVGSGDNSSAAPIPGTRMALVHPSTRKPRTCDYWIAPSDPDRQQALERWRTSPGAAAGSVRIEEWHASLRKFGALELNDRYIRAVGRPMTSQAWRGWFAVKALVETYLRDPENPDACSELASMTFDGHKGRPLAFDRDSRGLRQPLYVVRRWNGADEVIAEV